LEVAYSAMTMIVMIVICSILVVVVHMLYDSVYLLRKRVRYPSRSRQFGAGLWEVARGAIPVTYSTLGV